MMATKATGKPLKSGQCVACEYTNDEGSRYCGGCGSELLFACPKCQKDTEQHVLFCGKCGLNIQDHLETELASIKDVVQKAKDCWGEGRFITARSMLLRVSERKLAYFRDVAGDAKKIYAEIVESQEKNEKHCEEVCRVAKEMLNESRYKDAVGLIGAIRESYRDEETKELLKSAESKCEEVSFLTSEVTKLVKQGELIKLLPKVERLRLLVPDDQRFETLGKQIYGRLFTQAQTLAAKHKYAAAMDRMSLLDSSKLNEKETKVYRLIREMHCLSEVLCEAAIVDRQLLSITELAQRVMPKDPMVASAAKQVRELKDGYEGNGRFAGPPWKNQDDTALGCRVELFDRPEKIVASETMRQQLKNAPRQLYTAMGFALRAIDRCEVETSFDLSIGGKALLGRLKDMNIQLTRGRAPSSGWGVDIGSTALYAVKLRYDAQSKSPVVAGCLVCPHERPLHLGDSEEVRTKQSQATLEKFAQQANVGDEPVVVGLHTPWCLGRFFSLPKMSKKQLNTAIEFEAQHQLPVSSQDLVWKWKQLHDTELEHSIMIFAARRLHVEGVLQQCQAAGLKVVAVQPNAVGLHNFIRHEFSDEEGTVAAVDVGASGSSIVISSPERCWFRTLTASGELVTRQFSSALKISRAQAEKAKRDYAGIGSIFTVNTAVETELKKLRDDIRASFEAYGAGDQEKIRLLAVVGGGADTHGLLRVLRRKEKSTKLVS